MSLRHQSLRHQSLPHQAAAAAALILILAPSLAQACACGCGVFDVGGGSLLTPGKTGVISLEYDLLDQTQNWSGDKRAPAANNPDKRILTHFIKIDGEFVINHDWSVMVDVPIADRRFNNLGGGGVALNKVHDTALGDVRIMADYTGLSEGMSTGLSLGLKLPTGDFRAAGFDRDTQIGSGSTDLLIGGHTKGALTKDLNWNYFVQGVAQIPIALQGGYRPGHELDAAGGVFYDGFVFGGGRFKISPLLQAIVSVRAPDAGLLANRPNSGYERLMLSPGLQFTTGDWRAYGDVEFPVYQRVNGNQLVAPVLFKVALSRSF
jgi:hypothetical protein